jgi:hypothetical protein
MARKNITSIFQLFFVAKRKVKKNYENLLLPNFSCFENNQRYTINFNQLCVIQEESIYYKMSLKLYKNRIYRCQKNIKEYKLYLYFKPVQICALPASCRLPLPFCRVSIKIRGPQFWGPQFQGPQFWDPKFRGPQFLGLEFRGWKGLLRWGYAGLVSARRCLH